MLLMDESSFLDELKSNKSKSQLISSESNSEDTNSIVRIPDEIIMENSTYDGLRKPSGIPNIPNEVRPVIGALALLTSQKEVEEAFGVSKDTIGNLSNDNHSNGEVTERKEGILDRIRTHTENKIEKCVEFLSIHKDMPNKELLATAESLSRIHKNIAPLAPEADGKTQFIFYIPERQTKIEEFGEVINASI
jgi:hypothetical protein